MDWRNYQFWRKDIRRVDETTAEFDLLVQRTKQRITIGERIGESLRLFQGSSKNLQSVSRKETFTRKLRNLGQGFGIFKKL
mgnify:CR=1 FL=1